MDGEKWDLTHAHAGSFRQANANGEPSVLCSIRSQSRRDAIARPPRQERLMMLILKGLCLEVSTWWLRLRADRLLLKRAI